MKSFRLSDGTPINAASFDNLWSRTKRAVLRTANEVRRNPKAYAKVAAPGAVAGAALTALVMALLGS